MPLHTIPPCPVTQSLLSTYQAIQEQMKLHGQEPVSFHDVKDEIFDMVRPADPYKLTLQDLTNWSVHIFICVFVSLPSSVVMR